MKQHFTPIPTTRSDGKWQAADHRCVRCTVLATHHLPSHLHINVVWFRTTKLTTIVYAFINLELFLFCVAFQLNAHAGSRYGIERECVLLWHPHVLEIENLRWMKRFQKDCLSHIHAVHCNVPFSTKCITNRWWNSLWWITLPTTAVHGCPFLCDEITPFTTAFYNFHLIRANNSFSKLFVAFR